GRDDAFAGHARPLGNDPARGRAPPPGQAARAHGRSLRMIAPVERAMAVEVDQRVRIAAAPERVWRALTHPDDLQRWLFPSAAAGVVEPDELAGTLAQLAQRQPALRPYWYAEHGRIVLVLPGRAGAAGSEPRRSQACDVLCLALRAGADLEAARASLERSLP